MIGLYVEGGSWLHRLAAGWKLIVLLLVSILIMQLRSVPQLSLALAATLALYPVLGMGWIRRLQVLRPLWPILVIILLVHGLPGDWSLGLLVVLRLCTMVLLAHLVTLTTRLDAMLAAIEPLFRPLAWIGISPRLPALAMVLVIRFVPVLAGIREALDEAWRARDPSERGLGRRRTRWYGKWRKMRALLPPLLIQALRLSDQVAEALTARGGAAGFRPEP